MILKLINDNCSMLMSSKEKSEVSKKNLFCRDTYWKLINNVYCREVFTNKPGARLRTCTYVHNCRGAHCESEINVLPHIKSFEVLDKTKLNLLNIYHNILEVFDKSRIQILNPLYLDKIKNFSDLNFIQLLNLWFEITCYHRKLKKEMTADPSIKSEFQNVKDIPQFELEEEDTVWSLERLTKMCPVNIELHRKINSKVDSPTIWDMCLASVNCKLGCHNEAYMVCNDDLLYGSCLCQSKDDFDKSKNDILNEINLLKESLADLTKKKKDSTNKKIKKLYEIHDKMTRKKHLTEEGLIPFRGQLDEFNRRKEEEQRTKNKILSERANELKTSVVKNKLKKPVF